MRKLDEVNYRGILNCVLSNHDSGYIQYALRQNVFCFRVLLQLDEFKNLLITTSPTKPEHNLGEETTIEEAVTQICEFPDFLESSHSRRSLNGLTIRRHLSSFGEVPDIEVCFIRDKDAGMRETGMFFVADGMHRLVAYGLWSELNPFQYQPVSVYLCTNEPL